jgi:hypothetical protein
MIARGVVCARHGAKTLTVPEAASSCSVVSGTVSVFA